MFTPEPRWMSWARPLLGWGLLLCACAAQAQSPSPVPASAPYGLGRPASAKIIAAWDIDVDPHGHGLPPGRGSVAQGARLFAEKCAACHGSKGQGQPADALVGGDAALGDQSRSPVKTVGNFWPYATTLFDFIRRAMPYSAPQSLANDEVYALTAWILHANGLLPETADLDAAGLAALKMPNEGGFVVDARPDVANWACRTCR
jgi:cytochrome c